MKKFRMMFVAAALCAVGMITSSIMAQAPGAAPGGARPANTGVAGGANQNPIRTGTQPVNPPANNTSANTSTSPGNTIVVVEMENLLTNHPEFVIERQRFEANAKQLQDWAKQEADKLNDGVAELQTLDVTSPNYRTKSEELTRRNSSIQTEFKLKQDALQVEYMKKVSAVYDKISAHIDLFAKNNRIAMILFIPTKDPSAPAAANVGVVAWHHESLNITQHIDKMIKAANNNPNQTRVQ